MQGSRRRDKDGRVNGNEYRGLKALFMQRISCGVSLEQTPKSYCLAWTEDIQKGQLEADAPRAWARETNRLHTAPFGVCTDWQSMAAFRPAFGPPGGVCRRCPLWRHPSKSPPPPSPLSPHFPRGNLAESKLTKSVLPLSSLSILLSTAYRKIEANKAEKTGKRKLQCASDELHGYTLVRIGGLILAYVESANKTWLPRESASRTPSYSPILTLSSAQNCRVR